MGSESIKGRTGKPNTVAYQGGTTISYTYDVLDNLRQVQDNSGIITNFDYDQVNRIESMIDGNNFSSGYGYDEAGNLTTLTYPGNRTVTYTYDELNRLRTLSIDWLSKTATYSYDTAGRMRQLTQFNGTIAKYTYDNANRLTALENRAAGNGTVITTYSFTLDGNGNRGNAVQLGSLPLGIGSSSIDYGYNTKKNRLTSAGSTTFGYDDEFPFQELMALHYSVWDGHSVNIILNAGLSNFCGQIVSGFTFMQGNKLKGIMVLNFHPQNGPTFRRSKSSIHG